MRSILLMGDKKDFILLFSSRRALTNSELALNCYRLLGCSKPTKHFYCKQHKE